MRLFAESRSPVCIRAVLLSAMLVLGLGSLATAQTNWDQRYQRMEELANANQDDLSRDERSELRQIRSEIRDAQKAIRDFLEGNGPRPNDVTEFFNGVVFPSMVSKNAETLSTLGSLRADFLKDYLSDRVVGNARQGVLDISIPQLMQIANDANQHPAARHNAVTLLGLLDVTPGDRLAGVLPTPSPAAFNNLRDLMVNAATPDFLKVAALAGLQRHMEIFAAVGQGPDVTAITNELLAIVNGGGAGSDDWQPDLKYWLKRRAIQTLGSLRRAGTNGDILTAFRQRIADPDEQIWVQFDAVQGLAKMDLSGAGDQARGLAFDVGQFVANQLEAEGNQLKSDLDLLVFRNIVFSDRDLLFDASKKKTGSGRDRSGDAPTIGSGGSGSTGNLDEGGGGGDSGQNASGEPEEEPVPKVEVANYRLNATRRTAKVLAHFVREAYASGGGLAQVADGDPNEKKFVEELRRALTDVIDQTDIGIEDIDASSTKGDRTRSYTEQVSQSLSSIARRIRKELPQAEGGLPGEGDAEAAAPADAAEVPAQPPAEPPAESGGSDSP